MKTPFDWMLYIYLGKTLGTEAKEEAIRTHISRAYYGLYNRLRIYKGLTTRYRPHQELIEKLKEANDFDDEKELAKLLSDMRKFRVDADYNGIIEIDEKYARAFWEKLDKAIRLFEKNTKTDES